MISTSSQIASRLSDKIFTSLLIFLQKKSYESADLPGPVSCGPPLGLAPWTQSGHHGLNVRCVSSCSPTCCLVGVPGSGNPLVLLASSREGSITPSASNACPFFELLLPVEHVVTSPWRRRRLSTCFRPPRTRQTERLVFWVVRLSPP